MCPTKYHRAWWYFIGNFGTRPIFKWPFFRRRWGRKGLPARQPNGKTSESGNPGTKQDQRETRIEITEHPSGERVLRKDNGGSDGWVAIGADTSQSS